MINTDWMDAEMQYDIAPIYQLSQLIVVIFGHFLFIN